MKRVFTLIVILSLMILAFYWFRGSDKLSRENLLTAEVLNSVRGKIYSVPDIESSPFKYFFIDEDGNLYGIEPEEENEVPNIEIIAKIEELKNSNQKVEIKGTIEEKVEDYGEKRIIVKEIIKEIKVEKETVKEVEKISCQNQGGSIELKQVCVFPNGKQCDLESLIKKSCSKE